MHTQRLRFSHNQVDDGRHPKGCRPVQHRHIMQRPCAHCIAHTSNQLSSLNCVQESGRHVRPCKYSPECKRANEALQRHTECQYLHQQSLEDV
jgi:hypothetical protein